MDSRPKKKMGLLKIIMLIGTVFSVVDVIETLGEAKNAGKVEDVFAPSHDDSRR